MTNYRKIIRGARPTRLEALSHGYARTDYPRIDGLGDGDDFSIGREFLTSPQFERAELALKGLPKPHGSLTTRGRPPPIVCLPRG